MKKKGKLIVVEGTDGSGKATQVALLAERCKKEGIKAKKIDFPRYQSNVFGKLIRECLDGKHGDFLALDPKIASVLYAGDRFESSEKITGWLDEGFMVLADRYVSANQIHQGGKIRDEAKRRDFFAWLDNLEHNIFKLPRPDVILYLHLPIEISRSLLIERTKTAGRDLDQAEININHLLESQGSAVSIVRDLNHWFKIDCATDDGNDIRSREEIHQKVWETFQSALSI